MPSRRQTYQGHPNTSAFVGGPEFTFGPNWRSNYGMPYRCRSSCRAHSAAVHGLYRYQPRSANSHNYFSSRGHLHSAALGGLYGNGNFRNHGLWGRQVHSAALGGLYGRGSYRRR